LLDEVLMLFESETKKYNIRVTKKLASLPTVMGDTGQLQQAKITFMKEAIKEHFGMLVQIDVTKLIKKT